MWKQYLIDYQYIGLFLVIIIATFIVASLFRRIFNRFIKRSALVLNNDPTHYTFLKHATTATIYLLGFSWAIYIVPSLRTIASSLLAGAAILTVAVGFAAQHAISNIISGLFIVIFKPYGVNDRLTIKDTYRGVVEDVTLRHTIIRDFENRRIVIPNSVISEEVVINASLIDEHICKLIDFGISYDSDIDLARKIIRETVLEHPFFFDARTPEQIEQCVDEVQVRVVALADFSVTVRVWAWARNSPDGFTMQCDILEQVKKKFDKQGVEIPFPYRTVVYKKDLPGNTVLGNDVVEPPQ